MRRRVAKHEGPQFLSSRTSLLPGRKDIAGTWRPAAENVSALTNAACGEIHGGAHSVSRAPGAGNQLHINLAVIEVIAEGGTASHSDRGKQGTSSYGLANSFVFEIPLFKGQS